MEQLPKYQDLISPMIQILSAAGKPLTNIEIELAIIAKLDIPVDLASKIHSGKRTELQYRLAWARTKAKTSGLIMSPKRETWNVTTNSGMAN
jgi:restriction system protein